MRTRTIVFASVLLLVLVLWAARSWAHMENGPAFPCNPPPPSDMGCV